ncbi:MAG TPA: sigma 54-interacting transcriptional regulator, partial [Patescibacteria group bacterium]|nr:sigma 54-interacting transcriptional regulator [Patescibacteria group bacterium]
LDVETVDTRVSYVRSGTFVGRHGELERLIGFIEATHIAGAGEPGTLLMLSGESGIGKSRLLRQLKYEAQLRGGSCASGQCYEGSAAAFHPFLQILRQILPDGSSDESLHRLLAPVSDAAAAEGVSGDPERELRRVSDAAVSAIVEAAGSRPLMVCVEDIQWADTASLNLLEHLARNMASAGPLMLIATYRSEEAEAPPLSTALPRLLRCADWQKMELSRLRAEDVAAMLAGMFGLESAPADLVDLILRETEGNPFFVQVAVEALIEEQELARPGIDWHHDVTALSSIPFPRSVSDAIARRLTRLDAVETAVLEALAVGEKPVEEPLLLGVLGVQGGSNPFARSIDGLLRRRLVAREVAPSGGMTLRIDHVRTRDHVYESMDWGRRRDLHGRFGLALEALGSAGVEDLAHHFISSPDAARALDYAERAGAHAMALCASERAIHYFERALEMVGPGDAPRRLRVQLNLAHALRQARQNAKAIDAYDRVVKGARAAGLRRLAYEGIDGVMDLSWRTGQHEEAQRIAEKVIPVLRAEGEKGILSGCLCSLANSAATRGRFEEARDLNQQALALRREIEDPHGTAACLNNLGLLDMVLNPTDEGRAQLEEALALRRRLGDHQQAAEVLGNLGVWHRKRGEFTAAAARIEEALEFGRQHRDRWLVGQSQANLASIYLAQARMDRAHAAAREAIVCARAVGDELLECEALDYLGMVERELGRPVEAEAAHERAVTLARRAGLAIQEAYALASLALDRPSQDARLLKENLRKAVKIASPSSSPRLQSRLHEASGRASLAGGELVQATQSARLAIETATPGRFTQSIAAGELLLGDCLLAEENDAGVDEASQAAGRAIAAAAPVGLLEAIWQGHAMIAEIARRKGRRALERGALAEAAEALQRAADSMTDEPIRLAYLAAPRRAEVLRRASALAVRRKAEAGDGSPERALAAIYEIASIINSMSDLDTLLDRVLDVGLGIVGGERGLITLLDDTTGEQRIAAARDLEEETVRDALEYSRSIVKQAAAGRIIVALDASSDDRFKDFKSVGLYAIKSLLCVPMKSHDKIIGTVYVDSRRQGAPFDEQDLRFLEAFANLAAGAVGQARLQERLASENVYLMREAGERNRYQNIIGKNVKMQAVYDLMEKVAASNLPVLINGESGTGKELVARALHYSGPRRHRKFFSENVAAIPDTLLESEMFGHVRGAFTGADRDRKGLFELADGGTLFLDEIGDMSVPMQSKLLRALQEGEIRPVGGKESRRVDVRIITATNKDLDRMMKEGRFREDLYYRINVVKIPLPSLRERKEDIPLLVDHFLQKITREAGKPPLRMEMGALQLLLRYSWPGNIRELENEVARLAVLCPGDVITQRDLMESGELFDKITSLEEKDSFTPLEEMERRQIVKALMEAAGNRGRAAELLGISRATIFRKLRKFNISH